MVTQHCGGFSFQTKETRRITHTVYTVTTGLQKFGGFSLRTNLTGHNTDIMTILIQIYCSVTEGLGLQHIGMTTVLITTQYAI